MFVRKSVLAGMRSVVCGATMCAAGPALANNVQVALEGSQLKVTGDGRANQLTVRQEASGDVVISGANGTLINRRPSVRLPRPAIEVLDMRLGGGNDVVTFDGLVVAVDASIDLGGGNDVLQSGASPSSIGVNLSVFGGSGNDTARITGWQVGESVSVDGQVGTLTAEIRDSLIGGSLIIIGDEARDVITLTSTSVGLDASVETKGGNDQVVAEGLQAGVLAINTDLGTDSIRLSGVSVALDLGVFTGTENDSVSLTDVSADFNVTVSLDAGSDLVQGQAVFAGGDAVFEGGAGVDTYIDGGIAGTTKTEVKEFEIFP